MGEPGRHADQRERRAAPAITAAVLLGVPLAVVLVSTIWVARLVVSPPGVRRDDILVLDVDLEGETVTVEAAGDAAVQGTYGFWFNSGSGHARLGEVVERTPDTVTRRLLGVDFGDLERARAGRLSGWVHLTPKSLGVPFETVWIQTPLGDAPAWLVPAADPTDRWVIQVHGRGVRRSEAIRAVPVFREAGYTSLLISWRNDGEAPSSSDRRYALGGSEWEDVDAALLFAQRHGARQIVLMGWSMGGAVVLQTALRSPNAEAISGIVLESPVVAWAPTLAFQAKSMRVPGPIRRAGLRLLSSRRAHGLSGSSAPIDFDALDAVARAAELHAPILLLHSEDDGFVPATASLALAEARPDIVSLRYWKEARHTRLWNFDPVRFTTEIRAWLATLDPS